MLFIVSSSIVCLPMDSLINGEFIDTRQLNNVAQTYSDSQRAVNVIANKSSHFNTFDSNANGESRSSNDVHKRVKRLHIFRPLFVYRQEQVKRRRIIEKRKLREQKQNNTSSVDRHTSTAKSCTNYRDYRCCYECRPY